MVVRKMFKFVPALMVVAAGTLLLAGCHRGHCGWSTPEEKAEKVTKRLAKELDLSEPQRAKLDALKDDVLSRKADFKAIKDGFHGLMLGQLRAGSVDQALVNQDLETREAKAEEMRAFLVSKLAEFHAILEPAQREKLAARLESRMKDCR